MTKTDSPVWILKRSMPERPATCARLPWHTHMLQLPRSVPFTMRQQGAHLLPVVQLTCIWLMHLNSCMCKRFLACVRSYSHARPPMCIDHRPFHLGPMLACMCGDTSLPLAPVCLLRTYCLNMDTRPLMSWDLIKHHPNPTCTAHASWVLQLDSSQRVCHILIPQMSMYLWS